MDAVTQVRLDTLKRKHGGKSHRGKASARPVSSKVRLLFINDLTAAGFGSRATIWRKVKSGELPHPFMYGVRAAWREATLEARLNKMQPLPGKAG